MRGYKAPAALFENIHKISDSLLSDISGRKSFSCRDLIVLGGEVSIDRVGALSIYKLQLKITRSRYGRHRKSELSVEEEDASHLGYSTPMPTWSSHSPPMCSENTKVFLSGVEGCCRTHNFEVMSESRYIILRHGRSKGFLQGLEDEPID